MLPSSFKTLAFIIAALLATSACGGGALTKEENLQSGERYFSEKKYSEAIVRYRNALQQDPQYGEARLRLAEAYVEVGDAANAYREYIRAADLLPSSVEAQNKAASLLLLAGQYEDAKERALKGISADGKNARAHMLLGNALAGLKDFDGAMDRLQQAIAFNPDANGFISLAEVQRARGQSPEAETLFLRALEVEPKSVIARLSLAQYYWAKDDATRAEEVLKAAVATSPSDELANRGLAIFYMYTGRVAAAEPYLRTLADADNSRTLVQKTFLVDYYLSQDRVEDAQRTLKSAIQMGDALPPNLQIREAFVQYLSGKRTEAHRSLDASISKNGGDALALTIKARFLAAERRYDEAAEWLRKAIALNPKDPIAHYLLGSVHNDQRNWPGAVAEFSEVISISPRSVPARVHLSQINLAQGRADLALQYASDAYNQAPADRSVRLALARGLIASGNFARAREVLTSLLKDYPADAAIRETDGELLAARQEWTSARAAFEKALSLEPSSIAALSGLIGVDVAQAKFDNARIRLDQRLTKSPASPDLLLLSARLHSTAGQNDRATNDLKEVLAVQPNNLTAFILMAQVSLAGGHLEAAREQFERLVAKEPNSVVARTMVAMILHQQGKLDEARRKYEEVLGIDPRAGIAANNLASMYADSGENLDRALELAQTAKRQMPNEAAVSDTLGWTYYLKRMASLGLPHLQDAARRDPLNPTYRYHLGAAYVAGGDKAAAGTELQEALKLSATFDGAEDARRLLASLSKSRAAQ